MCELDKLRIITLNKKKLLSKEVDKNDIDMV
jgi:hypothetical protein